MYPIITFLGREIGVYAVCSVMGLVICGFVAARFASPLNFKYDNIIILMLIIAGGMFLGGHILFGVTNINRMYNALTRASELNFSKTFSIVSAGVGGMVFYGGFLGACLALLIYVKHVCPKYKSGLFDILAVCIPLFHTFGRIGCFFGGCCYGIESSLGITVYDNVIYPEINGVSRFPVQLVEAACNFLIFVLIFTLYKKNKLGGRLIFLYMLVYSVARFFLEFLRGDEIRGIWFGVSTSQWISLCLFAFATVKFVLYQKNRSNLAKL